MITNDKIIEIFCATDEFSKKYEEEIENSLQSQSYAEYHSIFHPKIQQDMALPNLGNAGRIATLGLTEQKKPCKICL